MATKAPTGQAISEVARREGGPTKGSHSAQMQSEVTNRRNEEQGTGTNGATANSQGNPLAGSTDAQAQSQATKERNFEQAAQAVGSKMQTDPSSVTARDAAYLESRESRALGGMRPPTDSIAAEAQRLAAANEKGEAPSTSSIATSAARNSTVTDRATQTSPGTDRGTQSNLDKEANFQQAVGAIKPKMESDPAHVIKEDANLLRSREVRAHGDSERGGIAAQAQRIVAENEKKTRGTS